MRKLWIADGPVTDDVVATALEAGATEVVVGIPPALASTVAAGTLGYVEVSDPEPAVDVPYVDPAEELRSAMLDALAPLTPSSTSATMRTALLALKAALA